MTHRLAFAWLLVASLAACPRPSSPGSSTLSPTAVEVTVVPPVEELLVQVDGELERGLHAAANETVKRILTGDPLHLEGWVFAAVLAERTREQSAATKAWAEVERILVFRGKLVPFVSPAALFAAAQHYLLADRMERSRLFSDELSRRFPTSDWGIKAQLAAAEVAYERERWSAVVQACVSLKRLQSTHPSRVRCERLVQAARRMQTVGPRLSATVPRWTWEHPRPQGNSLNAIWVAPEGAVFVVGEAGTILQQGRDARELSAVPSGTRWSLKGVAGSAANNVYAVGAAGIVLHYDGARWSIVRKPDPLGADLWDVYTARPGHAVAVGDQGVVLTLAGDRWQLARPAPTADLRGVWGRGPGDLVAAGMGGTLLRFQGEGWQLQPSDSYEDLWSVWGSPTGPMLAVGSRKTVVHLDGGKAKEEIVGRGSLRSVWGLDDKHVWAVGVRGEVVQFDGRQWLAERSGCVMDLLGIAGRSAEDLWAVGEGGTLLRRSGKRWRLLSGGMAQHLVAVVAGGKGETLALGMQGALLRRERDGRWQPAGELPGPGVYHDLWGNGTRWIAVGDQGLLVVRQGRKWTRLPTDTAEDLLAVWGYEGGAVAVGTRGTILRLTAEGRVIHDRPPTGFDLRRVWGSSPNALVAVGNRGTVVRFDGERWVEQESGVLADLLAVWSVTPQKLIAVGSGGAMVELENGRARDLGSPLSQTLVGVWGAAGKLFVISAEGAISKFNGATWEAQDSPAACLTAISGDAETGPLAVGCYGTVLRGPSL